MIFKEIYKVNSTTPHSQAITLFSLKMLLLSSLSAAAKATITKAILQCSFISTYPLGHTEYFTFNQGACRCLPNSLAAAHLACGTARIACTIFEGHRSQQEGPELGQITGLQIFGGFTVSCPTYKDCEQILDLRNQQKQNWNQTASQTSIGEDLALRLLFSLGYSELKKHQFRSQQDQGCQGLPEQRTKEALLLCRALQIRHNCEKLGHTGLTVKILWQISMDYRRILG